MKTHEEILLSLDPQQRQVAKQLKGPVCVLAGAGTGKTRAITHRIAYAIATNTVSQSSVRAVTFTQRAALEMKQRLAALGYKQVMASTFHAAALDQLRYFWPQTVGGPLPKLEANSLKPLAKASEELGLKLSLAQLKDLNQEISWARLNTILPEKYPAAVIEHERRVFNFAQPRVIAQLMARFADFKAEAEIMDLNDVLALNLALLKSYPQMAHEVRQRYSYYVVDEFQDVSPLQFQLLKAWLGNSQDICVVGDISQTIYSFSGANPGYLRDFQQEFKAARLIKLEQNYRSDANIVQLANELIATTSAALNLKPTLMATKAPTLKRYPNEVSEATAIAQEIAERIDAGAKPSDFAVLLRTTWQTEAFERAFQIAQVPYVVKDKEDFFSHPEVKNALSAIRIARGSFRSGDDLELVLAELLSSLGWSKIPPAVPQTLASWARLNAIYQLAMTQKTLHPAYDLTRLYQDLIYRLENRIDLELPGVTLASIHSTKGLEWEVVYLAGLSQGLMPISKAKTSLEIAEERRLLYVAITRAKAELNLSYAGAKGSESSRSNRKLSPFLSPLLTADKEVDEVVLKPPIEPTLTEAKAPSDPQLDEVQARFLKLRKWRTETAKAEGMPAFAILTDTTLLAVAKKNPVNLADLKTIKGFGIIKIQNYGDKVLAVLN